MANGERAAWRRQKHDVVVTTHYGLQQQLPEASAQHVMTHPAQPGVDRRHSVPRLAQLPRQRVPGLLGSSEHEQDAQRRLSPCLPSRLRPAAPARSGPWGANACLWPARAGSSAGGSRPA